MEENKIYAGKEGAISIEKSEELVQEKNIDIQKIKEQDLEEINFDALKIAEVELNSGILPISIQKPFPKLKEELKESKKTKISDKNKEEAEIKEEEEIANAGEIMELANPEEEREENN
jgi:hypothetical protein